MNTYNPRPDLFVTNKFTNCYFFVINRSKQYDRKKLSPNDPDFVYYERHHIIPRSLGGNDSPENLVLLTAYEHYLFHWLLTKMCQDEQHRKKLLYPLRCMTNKTKLPSLKNLAKLYEESKADLAKLSSETNLGRKHSDEFRAKQRELNSGPNNGMYGKSHSDSTAQIMADKKVGQNNPNFQRSFNDGHKQGIAAGNKGKDTYQFKNKTFLLEYPDGSKVTVTDRRKFAAENGLRAGSISNAAVTGKLYRGIKVSYL